jgi:hypothetical protein
MDPERAVTGLRDNHFCGKVGDYLKPLSEIPIKRIAPDEQKPFIKLVDRILAAKQRDAEADTSALEREIDQLVYALYGLTPEEIKIVEGAAK